MDWQAIAATGELLGALGVIASLVYLARQVRSNAAQTRESAAQTRHAAAQSVINNLNAYMESLSHREHAGIFARGIKGLKSLEDFTEVTQFSARMFTLCRPYEELFYYRKTGAVDPWVWSSVERMMGDLLSNPGVAEWWSVRGHWFSPEFQDHVAELIGTPTRDLEADYTDVRPSNE